MQIAGSRHHWLEDRGPTRTLLMAVDDATGALVQSVSHTTEDSHGYLMTLEPWSGSRASPCFYNYQHAAFKHNAIKYRCRSDPHSSPV